MASKKEPKRIKYYVVWEGRSKGIFTSWEECSQSTLQYPGAKFKSFDSLEKAQEAFSYPYEIAQKFFAQKNSPEIETKKGALGQTEITEKPSAGIAVDGGSHGNPGPAEYRGVRLEDGVILFATTPIFATNNIVEFLAIVHAMALCKKEGKRNIVIYSDSKTALSWVKKGKCNTKIPLSPKFNNARELIQRAEAWLAQNPFEEDYILRKWDTELWGEIPADYGRKNR